jgi:GT2 family glycosyltransferase
MEKKIGIVLLNYNGYVDTINCLESIYQQKGINASVCIVDNASLNSSVKKIKQFLENAPAPFEVKMIVNSENLGFAKGNNIGIKYLRQKGCDYVFVLNNDTLLTKDNSLITLIDMDKKDVGVINPACSGFNGEFQEPYMLSQGKMFSDYIKALALTLWQIMKGIVNSDYSIHKHKQKAFNPKEHKYIIQGNAYILTPAFFENYTQIFPNTFLYFEELYLLWYLQKAGLSTVYNENVIILHREAGSEKKTTHSYKMRKAFNMMKSVLKGAGLIVMSREVIQKKYS